MTALVENTQVQRITLAMERVVLKDIDRGGLRLDLKRNIDKGHDLRGIDMARQVESDRSPSRDTSPEGGHYRKNCDSLHL
jgi:hypothetical protein